MSCVWGLMYSTCRLLLAFGSFIGCIWSLIICGFFSVNTSGACVLCSVVMTPSNNVHVDVIYVLDLCKNPNGIGYLFV